VRARLGSVAHKVYIEYDGYRGSQVDAGREPVLTRRARRAAVPASLANASPVPFWLDRCGALGGPGAPEGAGEHGAPPSLPPLDGTVSADLAVIGGGFSGLWTALLAKERDPGAEGVLVEGRRIAWAGTGRNGGFCSSSLTHGLANGLARFGAEIATLERLGRQKLDEIDRTFARTTHAVLERTGELAVATRRWQLDGLPNGR
jgi:hypothetical protein